MKPNRFKQVRAAGRVPVGQMLWEFGTRGIAQMLDVVGLDFVLIDTEHAPFSTADVADLVAWFSGTTIAPFVRVPQIEYHLLARTMDAGALGVMVPNVKNAEEARAIVDAVKYAPLGKRGVGLGGGLTGYRTVTPAEFLTYSNENTTIICQIESVEGVENIEAICATPGVDVVWVGHFDLTQSMGITAQFHDERFLDALRRVTRVAKVHGIGAGIQPGSVAQAREWMDLGFDVISYSTDMAVYLAAMHSAVGQVRALTQQ